MSIITLPVSTYRSAGQLRAILQHGYRCVAEIQANGIVVVEVKGESDVSDGAPRPVHSPVSDSRQVR